MKKQMNHMSSKEIREAFLSYFKKLNHEIVPSSPLVAANDPTLLFVNAGMVQFKDVFLGQDHRPYKRATSSQRCVRAGGKHNDLERVGYTARHHTFFEMLGNFSFGDYFKRDAIQFAWQFLTETLQLPPEKLWITTYKDDTEAEAIWLNEIKINPHRFSRCDEHDNFWSMGPTGPCGPCTEIFYDHGAHIPGGPPGSDTADGDRYIEIWNIVFMQYDRAADGTLTPLPKPSVDTGMGLERISAVLQGVHNNYDTDLFQPLIKAIAVIARTTDLNHTSLRVIADHIRSACFLIADGIIPSNEGRGYVLRRIIRRALRHGNKLGISDFFFHTLVAPLTQIMGEAYPLLLQSQTHIEQVLKQEEAQFSTTLTQGLKLFEQAVSDLPTDVIPGHIIFKLYDTYGFPVDLIADIARERHLVLDEEGFESAMAKQRERSRETSHFAGDYHSVQNDLPPTEFTGYHHEKTNSLSTHVTVMAIHNENHSPVQSLKAGEKGYLILDRTPFYAESGGQVGDQGTIRVNETSSFSVFNTIKQGRLHLHFGKCEKGLVHSGDAAVAEVDAKRRAKIVLNHSATHLLHFVLRQMLGERVVQKGSLVEPDRLRFDFAYSKALTKTEVQEVENRVNEEIRANHAAKVIISTQEEAIKNGAIALFGEKYDKEVRVVSFGQSVELCGGTHAEQTGDIGLFKITNETGIASGIRRIEAVTGEGALDYLNMREQTFEKQQAEATEQLSALEKELQAVKGQLGLLTCKGLVEKAELIGDIKVIATKVAGLEPKALRQGVDYLKQQLGTAIIVLATVKDRKVSIIGAVSSNLTETFSAKDIVDLVASQVGGKSGGRKEMAEGGGNQPEGLEKALADVYTWIKERAS